MSQRITIGRSPECTIVVGEFFDTVSNNHADIFIEEGRLMLADHSSNGTIINGREINGRTVEINPGDTVRLADKFPLDWKIVLRYFPELSAQAPAGDERRTRRYDPAQNAAAADVPQAEPEPGLSARPQPETEPEKVPARGTERFNMADFARNTADPEMGADSHGTERFDSAKLARMTSDAHNSGIGTPAAGAGTVADDAAEDNGTVVLGGDKASKKKNKKAKAGKRRSSGASRVKREWPVKKIGIAAAVFVAVMAILAFTVFDDVVKNIL